MLFPDGEKQEQPTQEGEHCNENLEIHKNACLLAAVLAAAPTAAAETLTIGVLGVMSGPAASWGLVNKYCAEVTAKMYNADGGVDIGGTKYQVEIVAIDDKNDPKLSVSGAEKLVDQGIKYIIGPNVDTTAQSIRPVVERRRRDALSLRL